MAGKVGCGLLLAVLFAVAAVSRAPFAVFLLAWAVLVVVFLAWYARYNTTRHYSLYKCNWLPFYRPFSFAPQPFDCFADTVSVLPGVPTS